jgi:hypothetical protein
MVETFFKRSCTIHGLRQGPLAGHIDLLADHLTAHGFSRVHSRIQLRLVGHFNRWLEQKGIGAEQLDETPSSAIAAGSGTGSAYGLKMCAHWSGYSISCASSASRPVARPKPFRRRGRYCLRSTAATCATSADLPRGSVRNMLLFVDRFLVEKYPRAHFDFAALKPEHITTFVRSQATELGSVQAKHMVTALRGFFRYLRHRGEIDTDLAGCVPRAPDYSFSTVPKFLPAGSVEKILRRTDRSTPRGRRDYAILMLLARLGLRTCEVVRLELEDIDWGTRPNHSSG